MYAGFGEAVIDQQYRATILRATNHPARRLDDLLHPGIQVGVVEPGAEQPGHALLDLFIDRVDLGQPEGGDKGADQARTRQVDAFGKGAAQHSETDALALGSKTFEKALALQLIHARCLAPLADGRITRGQQGRDLLQVFKTAEKRQVIARCAAILPGNQLDDRRQRRFPVLVTGRDAANHLHLQLLGGKG
ncbi:hypothetical protein D3C85_1117710 [compost metagenome]